jgi:hypothetical protein
MKLIGIINALKFKEQVLDQREKIKPGNNTSNLNTETTTIQTHKLLEEIRDLLTDIKNKP